MTQGARGTCGVVDFTTPDLTVEVTNWNLPTGLQRVIDPSSGDIDPRFVAVLSCNPIIGFSTRQLSILASFGISGAAAATVAAYMQVMDANGVRNATSSKATMATGFCIPQSLTASQGGVAELTCQVIGYSDGATAPIIFGSGAQPAAATAEAFTIGPVNINGTAYDCESVTVDFGIQVNVDSSSGDVYPTAVSVMSRAPTIRLSCKENDAWTALGLTGLAQDTTDSTVYFRKLAANGTRTAEATAEHIKFTIDDGLISIDTSSLATGSPATHDVVITPVWDGTAAILVLSAASAIT